MCPIHPHSYLQLPVPSITSQELAQQEGHEDAHYLPLPPPLHAIIDNTAAMVKGRIGIRLGHNDGVDVKRGSGLGLGLGLRGMLVVDSMVTVQLAAQVMVTASLMKYYHTADGR